MRYYHLVWFFWRGGRSLCSGRRIEYIRRKDRSIFVVLFLGAVFVGWNKYSVAISLLLAAHSRARTREYNARCYKSPDSSSNKTLLAPCHTSLNSANLGSSSYITQSASSKQGKKGGRTGKAILNLTSSFP